MNEWPFLDEDDWNDFLAPDEQPEFDKEEYYRQKYEESVADDLKGELTELGRLMAPGALFRKQAE